MRIHFKGAILSILVVIFLFFGSHLYTQVSQPEYGWTFKGDVRIPMRDGVELSADMFVPDAEGKFPTILIRTPYDNNRFVQSSYGPYFASRGYVLMVQDVRGRGDSDGVFNPFVNEAEDGFDTHEWIGTQDWSNGKVGSFGGSYQGWTQVYPATLKSKYYTAMVPEVCPPDPFLNFPYQDGALMLAALEWVVLIDGRTMQDMTHVNWEQIYEQLPLIEMDKNTGRDAFFWREWVDHYTWDDYWHKRSYQEKLAKVDMPAIHITGWYDDDQPGCIQNFVAMRKHAESIGKGKHQRLIIGPWPHAFNRSRRLGDFDFGANSLIDINNLYLKWFDYWLKGKDTGILDEAPVKIFIMGDNVWRDEQEWPLARTEYTKYYFHSDGRANSFFGDGKLSTTPPQEEKPDTYVYDPANPVRFIFNPASFQLGSNEDQRPVERRDDVLCYTSDVLREDLEVTGPLKAKLYISSDVTDTDFFVRLVDVLPNGYAMRVNDNICKTRFRNSYRKAEPMAPGNVYELNIDLWATSLVFKKGHRIRVDVCSSAFPKFSRNRNTGEKPGYGTEIKIANQTIYHTAKYSSHIVLPVIPR